MDSVYRTRRAFAMGDSAEYMDKTAAQGVDNPAKMGDNKSKDEKTRGHSMATNTYNGAADTTNFASGAYLHINSCGRNRYTQRGEVTSFCTERPQGRVDFHILLVAAGQMDALCGGAMLHLTVGDAMLYGPGERQRYLFHITAEHPVSESLWVHFAGTAVPEILADAGLPVTGRVRAGGFGEAKRLFESMVCAHRAGDALTANGQLLRMMAQLGPRRGAADDVRMQALRAEAAFIDAHYAEPIDFDACAARCCLSRSRFSHLFTAAFGVAPLRYQQRLRMAQARELLTYSSLTIQEVAAQLGYEDPLYFSRLFRQVTGQTPTAVRTRRP